MNKLIKVIKQGRRRTLAGKTQSVSPVKAKTENQVRREIRRTVSKWIETRRDGESAEKTAQKLLRDKA